VRVLLAIYRGCFDAFKAVKQLTDDYVGCRNQTWNNRVRRWCLCDTDLCNRFPIHQNYNALPTVPAHRRSRIPHHHPVPPPQPAFSKSYLKDSGVEPIVLGTEEKSDQPASYRTVWTNWQALPKSHLHGQPTERRAVKVERKTGAGSTTRDHLGHVVSHSVYPDRWKENVAAVVDRRHAKSSQNVARGRLEPVTYTAEGQMSKSNYSAPPILQRYKPSNVESEAQPVLTVARQDSRGMLASDLTSAVHLLHFV